MVATLSSSSPSSATSPAGLAVDMEDVVGRYRGANFVSVDHVSLKVQRGAFLGLLGPNGAGKTTLLSMLCALMRPASGTVSVHGLSFDENPDSYKDLLGFVPQGLALYPRLTGRENLAVFGRMSGLRGDLLWERIEFALAFAGLSEFAGRRVGTYSGGQQRRLNLVTALLPDPPVLILDEPTVGVDPQSRHAIHENLRALSRAGKTIIYTSHYLDEIEHLCDEIAILDAGRLIARGPLDDLLARSSGQNIELRFDRDHVTRALAVLQDLAGVQEAMVASSLVTLLVDDAYLRLPGVLEALRAIAVRPVALSIGARDLEQVFLSLTGTRLRDGV